MYILAIDTACSASGAAIVSEDRVVACAHLDTGKTHSRRFLSMVASVLEVAEIDFSMLSVLAVTVGPGSFTGLRIGISTAKAWGYALDLPIIPVTTLEALSYGACDSGFVCPLLDARKNEVYTALYKKEFCAGKIILRNIIPPMAVSIDALTDLVLGTGDMAGQRIVFAGDALIRYAPILETQLGERFFAANGDRIRFMASSAALIARERFLKGEGVSAAKLRAFYLRRSEAETRRMVVRTDV